MSLYQPVALGQSDLSALQWLTVQSEKIQIEFLFRLAVFLLVNNGTDSTDGKWTRDDPCYILVSHLLQDPRCIVHIRDFLSVRDLKAEVLAERLLYFSINQGNSEIFTLIAQTGFLPQTLFHGDGYHPLLYQLCVYGNARMVQAAIDAGFSIHERGHNGLSAVQYTFERLLGTIIPESRYFDIMSIFIRAGARIDAKCMKRMLPVAIMSDKRKIVKRLFEMGFQPNCKAIDYLLRRADRIDGDITIQLLPQWKHSDPSAVQKLYEVASARNDTSTLLVLAQLSMRMSSKTASTVIDMLSQNHEFSCIVQLLDSDVGLSSQNLITNLPMVAISGDIELLEFHLRQIEQRDHSWTSYKSVRYAFLANIHSIHPETPHTEFLKDVGNLCPFVSKSELVNIAFQSHELEERPVGNPDPIRPDKDFDFLWHAIYRKCIHCLQELINLGAEVRISHFSEAIEREHASIFRVLLDAAPQLAPIFLQLAQARFNIPLVFGFLELAEGTNWYRDNLTHTESIDTEKTLSWFTDPELHLEILCNVQESLKFAAHKGLTYIFEQLLSGDHPNHEIIVRNTDFDFGGACRDGGCELIKVLSIPQLQSFKLNFYVTQNTLEKGQIEAAHKLLEAGAEVNALFGMPHPSRLKEFKGKTCSCDKENPNENSNRQPGKDAEGSKSKAAHPNDRFYSKEATSYLERISKHTKESRICTALPEAVLLKDMGLIRHMVSCGADVNGQGLRNSATALVCAVLLGDFDIARLLIELGADVDLETSQSIGSAALEAAMITKNQSMILFLLQYGVSLRSEKALIVAVECDREDILNLILDHYPQSVKRRPNFGCLALRKAVQMRSRTSVQILLNHGTNPHGIVRERWWTRSHCSFKHKILPRDEHMSAFGAALKMDACTSPGKNLNMTKAFFDSGTDPNSVVLDVFEDCIQQNVAGRLGLYHTNNRYSALLFAVEVGGCAEAQALIDAGALVNGVSHPKTIQSPLQLAAETGNKRMVELLISAGADANAPPPTKRGATALQYAAIGGYHKIVSILLDSGARVNDRGSIVDGRTVLEGAAEHGHFHVLRLLLDAGASLTGEGDKQFKNSIKLAADRGYHSARKLIESYREAQLFTETLTLQWAMEGL